MIPIDPLAKRYGELHLFIDGERPSDRGRQSRSVLNPATGNELARLPLADSEDLDRALDAAERGFALWRGVSAYERAGVLRRAAALIRERLEEIALRNTLEEGKLLSESRGEVAVAADIFDWFAEEGRRAYGRVIPSRSSSQRFTVNREPVGPVAAFTPWNFPASGPARKIAASLAAGCSCILKPAEETPATALALAQALYDAGLPPAVLSVVFGDPAHVSTRLIASDVIRKVSFTGSIAVGKILGGLAAAKVKPATLELGGHAPVLICKDADLSRVVPMSLAAKFRNAGQVCTSPTRFYVHDTLHDVFVDRMATASAALQVGNGCDLGSGMGPLANPRRIAGIEGLVVDAVAHGAELVTGGRRQSDAGWFWSPTVLASTPATARVMNEEPFGPILVTSAFTELEEALHEANRLPYGLASYAFTQSLSTANALSSGLQSGMVGVNTFNVTIPETPFGGRKESGFGSEGGAEGLDAYLTTKLVSQADL